MRSLPGKSGEPTGGCGPTVATESREPQLLDCGSTEPAVAHNDTPLTALGEAGGELNAG